MKTKLAKPSLRRETLVHLQDMARIAGGIGLLLHERVHVENRTRPCPISAGCP